MAEKHRERSRRGRQALLWGLGAFVLVQLAAGLLLDYCWPELRFPTADLTFKALSKQSRSPDIVCLGSSRFGAGFVQEEIRDRLRAATGDESITVFNAAIEAGDLVTADYIMERAVAQGVRPRLVVIEVSPETVARRGEWMGQHVIRQLTWDEIPEHLGDIWRSRNLLRLLSARLLPLHLHRQQICRAIYQTAEQKIQAVVKPLSPGKQKKPRAAEPAPDQGVPWEVFKEFREDRCDPRRTQAGLPAIKRWLRDYAVGSGSGRALEDLVQRCREHDMTVILVAPPVAEAHRSLYSPEIDFAFLCRVVDVSRRYGCQFVDYRARIPDRLFRDNHHLRQPGGQRFSRLLEQEVLLAAWLERQELAQ